MYPLSHYLKGVSVISGLKTLQKRGAKTRSPGIWKVLICAEWVLAATVRKAGILLKANRFFPCSQNASSLEEQFEKRRTYRLTLQTRKPDTENALNILTPDIVVTSSHPPAGPIDTYSGNLFQFSTLLMLAHTERLIQSIFNKNIIPSYLTPCPGVHYANVPLPVITRVPFLTDHIRNEVGEGAHRWWGFMH
ncbi:hypothetical protein CDAR_492911 [Caerostris darwini]|uniref:Uncharacterized protein n=1 Tax=Caerostris darwini TaxID=1538125 RepID=A0AAV4T8Y8_9ARAC|nr:hypothetical protein CDAR_492911 [Caerostris darwini]